MIIKRQTITYSRKKYAALPTDKRVVIVKYRYMPLAMHKVAGYMPYPRRNHIAVPTHMRDDAYAEVV